MMRILFKVGKKEKNKNYICSELVRDAFAKAGVVFKLMIVISALRKYGRTIRVELNTEFCKSLQSAIL